MVTKNFLYIPKSDYEVYAQKIYFALVENFAKTFYVGGVVRDLLLDRKVVDIDFATEARPEQVKELFRKQKIFYSDAHEQFGLIAVEYGGLAIEITTLRSDSYGDSRYPSVMFIDDVEIDSKRRDFTVNALYLSQKDNKIFDYYQGFEDISSRLIRFIGDPGVRIDEDPLRAVRAIRFALNLNFNLESETLTAIKNNFNVVQKISKTLLDKETKKIFDVALQKKFLSTLEDKKLLDTLAK